MNRTGRVSAPLAVQTLPAPLMLPDDRDLDPRTHLDPLADRLDALGLADHARRLRDLVSERPAATWDAADLISLAEAAVLLGLRSPSTVHGLFEQGLLPGVRHADGVLVSRAAVDQFADSPTLPLTRQVEEQLWSLLVDGEPS